jgi:acyl-CoA synthetase (NDP forming)
MSFKRLLNPRTIATFGGANAAEVIRQSELMGYQGEIWPVHPNKSEILGRKVYHSVSDLPGSPDAAYIGVNRNLTIDIVRELAERDAGGAVCYATGFVEAGEEGSRLSQQLLEASGDMPLIGPNCYGLLNYLNGAMLWPDQQGGLRVSEGVAIITMSSNVGFNLTMQRRGLPIAYMVSLGNRLKFELHDAIHIFSQQENVTALGLFLETMPDPKAFQEAVDFARNLGKPIVAMKVGRSQVAQKMVVSHTASLAGSDELVRALFKRLGVARVDSLEALIEALKVLHVLGPLGGGRIAAGSTSGGDLTLLADGMSSGLSMPALSAETAAILRQTVHERIVPTNPFDFQMFDWNNEDQNFKNFNALLSQEFDVAMCLLDYPRDDRCDQSTWLGAERGFVRAARETGTKAAILSTFSDTIAEPVAARLMKDGVAMLAGIDAGLAGIKAAVDIGAAWKNPIQAPLLALSSIPNKQPGKMLDEVESKAFFAQKGIPVPAGKVVGNAVEAVTAANQIGYPIVVKSLGLAHKTDVGGVVLNLQNARQVEEAVVACSNFSEKFLVEKMILGGVAELIIGIAQDEQFGPFMLLGGGGVLVELMKDSASILLPTTRDIVLQVLTGLKCAPLFQGFRGAQPADLDAAVDVILTVAEIVVHDPAAINELDINPLILLPKGEGVIAADAYIRLNSGVDLPG